MLSSSLDCGSTAFAKDRTWFNFTVHRSGNNGYTTRLSIVSNENQT